MTNQYTATLTETEDKLIELIGVKRFGELTEAYQRKLVATALDSTLTTNAAANLLSLNRTTVVEKIKRLGLRTTRDITKKMSAHTLNITRTLPRKCKECTWEFKGNYLTPCPSCGNRDKKMIKIKYKKGEKK